MFYVADSVIIRVMSNETQSVTTPGETIPVPSSQTRNSEFRSLGDRLTTLVAEAVIKRSLSFGVDKRIVSLYPDLITVAGGVATIFAAKDGRKFATASTLQERIHRARTGVLWAGVAVSADLFDGGFARNVDRLLPGVRINKHGANLDAGQDRWAEWLLCMAQLWAAYDRGDRLGIVLATASGISNFFPSAVRAEAEKAGKKVPETGKKISQIRNLRDIFSFLGTRGPRWGNLVLATFSADSRQQHIFSLLNIAGNTTSTIDRLNILNDKEIEPTLGPEAISQARSRSKMFKALGIAGSALLVGTALAANNKLSTAKE